MNSQIRRIADSIPRRSFADGSDAGIMMGDDEAIPLRLWWVDRGEADPEDLHGDRHPTQPCDRASIKPATSPVLLSHVEFVAAVAGLCPRTIPLDNDAIDLELRADHLNKVLSALSVYLVGILDDTAQNIPGRVDFGDIRAALLDLASDLTGTIQLAADTMAAGRIA
jgi:hypothetical protein